MGAPRMTGRFYFPKMKQIQRKGAETQRGAKEKYFDAEAQRRRETRRRKHEKNDDNRDDVPIAGAAGNGAGAGGRAGGKRADIRSGDGLRAVHGGAARHSGDGGRGWA